MTNQLGKRYECATCGGQIICVKGGEGAVSCCGVDMPVLDPKELPSAD